MRLFSLAAGAAALTVFVVGMAPPANARGALRGLAPLVYLPTEPNSPGISARDRRALRSLSELQEICASEMRGSLP